MEEEIKIVNSAALHPGSLVMQGIIRGITGIFLPDFSINIPLRRNVFTYIMAAKAGTVPLKEKIMKFWHSEDEIPSTIREIGSVLITVGIIVAILFLVCGTWPAIVTIESESMVPNMNVGDLVLVMAADRLSPLESMAEGNISGNEKFNKPGDVIIYHPNGIVNYPRNILEPKTPQNILTNLSWDFRTLIGWNQVHPIIHRALYWIDEGPTNITSREMNTSTKKIETKQYVAPHAGYITKGDNNPVIDQTGFGSNYRGLGSAIQPVKPEWIVGKAVFKVPLVGYLPLNIWPVIIVVIFFMVLHELYLRSRQETKPKKSASRKK